MIAVFSSCSLRPGAAVALRGLGCWDPYSFYLRRGFVLFVCFNGLVERKLRPGRGGAGEAPECKRE